VTDADGGFALRRIVVAIDSSAGSAAALDAVAALAARLQAELEGLFVEDVNLARLAELPVGREICFNGVCRDFTAVQLAAQYREQAAVARRALAAAAARARIACAFRVARGQVDVEIMSAAGSADLLVLGTGASALGRRGRLGRTARTAAERAPRSVLIAKPGAWALAAPLVYYDGSPGARRALAAAARIAGGRDGALTVLIVAAAVDRAAALRAEVTALLAPYEAQPAFLHGGQPAPAEICRLAARAGADVLVIAADAALTAAPDRLALLETIACPVLLVR
jgi:nucleotide-binding universal stress UspA family protein